MSRAMLKNLMEKIHLFSIPVLKTIAKFQLREYTIKKNDITIIPQCDFLKFEKKFSEKDGSFGNLTANHPGDCFVVLEKTMQDRGFYVMPLYSPKQELNYIYSDTTLHLKSYYEGMGYEYGWKTFGRYEKKFKQTFLLTIPDDMRDLPRKK